MSILGVILLIAVSGFLVWLVLKYVPMPAPFPTVLIVAVILIILFVILRQTGMIEPLTRPITR